MLPVLMANRLSGILDLTFMIQTSGNAGNGAMHIPVVQALLSLMVSATSGIINVHMISEVMEVLIFG